MNEYTRSGWRILRDYTEDLKSLDQLVIYLAKQTNSEALKSLKLLILAHHERLIKKDFDIHAVQESTYFDGHNERKEQQTIVSNLLQNPQHLSFELLDMIVHNYPIDFQLRPNKKAFWLWFRGLERIEYDNELFYKRYDMVDSKIQFLNFLVESEVLSLEQSECVSSTLTRCITDEYGYSEAQLLKMEKLNSKLKISNFGKAWFRDNRLNQVPEEPIERPFLEGASSRLSEEFNHLNLRNDECCYMIDKIPVLQKKKVIK